MDNTRYKSIDFFMLITFLELLSSAITDAEGARIRSLVDFSICFGSPSPLDRGKNRWGPQTKNFVNPKDYIYTPIGYALRTRTQVQNSPAYSQERFPAIPCRRLKRTGGRARDAVVRSNCGRILQALSQQRRSGRRSGCGEPARHSGPAAFARKEGCS